MLAAVEFDDELLFGACEIGDAVADRVLAAEFVEGKAVAEGAPENAFGVGGVGAKFAGDQTSASEFVGWHSPTSPSPLRPGGAERELVR
jgi:hypothetical protein